MERNTSRPAFAALLPYVGAMAAIVIASNILVQHPFTPFGLGELLTWGAFTYPFAFLANDLANRRLGMSAARMVVAAGFLLAVILSIWLATPRIAIASGTAFAVAQILDLLIFDRMRMMTWWKAPLVSSIIASAIDTALFFRLAFAPSFGGIDRWFGMEDGSLGFPVVMFGYEMPLWVSLAIGDFLVKVLIGFVALLPYAGLLRLTAKTPAANEGRL
ncbi:VUT family protein [Salaquimonas pukyongi]|uniref:VUT family protein n=1 Tax=Salaquimonas pukyongi TaxID=2712698 RepID=UPI00096B7A31|nr:VUT family protein [Salaquimonas pukyongi]